MSDTVRKNTTEAYGSVAKAFHWLTALLIFTAFPLGLIANGWPYDSGEALQTKFLLFSLHKTVGVTVFWVALLRIAWAISQPKPGALHPDRKLESFLADLVHWLLYGSLVLVPLSGWLHHAATQGYAEIWWPFGQGLPFVPKSDSVSNFFQGWHFVFTKVLAVAILLHVAGALKHWIIDRDGTLARMLPGQPAAHVPPQHLSRAPILVAIALYLLAMAAGTALGLSKPAPVTASAPSTSAVAAEWTVREGKLGIVVQQGGNAVEGHFADWSAAINFDPDALGPLFGDVVVEIAVPSLVLGTIAQQALEPEFFAATEYPTAVFNADILSDDQVEGGYIAAGSLTLRGAELPVLLPFELTLADGSAEMTGSTRLDRRDFEIGTASYNDEKTVGFAVEVSISLVADRATE